MGKEVVNPVDKLKDVWHKIENFKVIAPLTNAIRYTDGYLILADVADKLRHIPADGEAQDYFDKNNDRIGKIMSKLADEKSRRVYRHVIEYRCSRDRKKLIGIVDNNQYFNKDIIRFTDEEVFVDCGAFDGDTIRSFLKNLKKGDGTYKEIIALEPDPVNYKKLYNWLLKQLSGQSGGGLRSSVTVLVLGIKKQSFLFKVWSKVVPKSMKTEIA